LNVRLRTTIKKYIRNYLFSTKYFKYHFIHIPKNGGKSVQYAFMLNRYVSLSKPAHYRYVDIADRAGKDLRYFCIIRNPWRRTASRYMFGKQNARIWSETDPRRRYISNASFEKYVKEQRILPIPEQPEKPWMGPLSSWFNQLEWIQNENKKVVCDCLRLEHINDDISAYFKKRIILPRKNVTIRSYDYRSMYTNELIEIVAETFREDIEYFGFNYEGSATKNYYTLDK
jgi:hypothetical protein